MRALNYGDRLQVGLLIPCRNTVVEPEFNAMAPAGISFHVNRLRLLGTSRQQLQEMAGQVEEGSTLLAAAGVNLIGFHCTAASTLDEGFADRLIGRIEKATGLPAIATSSGLIAALKQLNARRIVMVTPYESHINDSEVKFFKANGIDVVDIGGVALPDARSMSSVHPEQWLDYGVALSSAGADACFLSCTNIRVTPILGQLEQRIGMPVIASNQVMLWHSLRSAGIHDRLPDLGQLLYDR